MKTRNAIKLLFFSIGMMVVFSSSIVALAQSGSPPTITDDQVNAIAKELYCPVCENVPLDVCGTQACEQWRELIRQKLAEGWSSVQIKQYFVDQYGYRVLATPPARGFNWLIYVIPPLSILAGGFILYRALRSWKTSQMVNKHQGDNSLLNKKDDYLTRIEEELKQR